MDRDRATLRVVHHEPPWAWTWVLSDARGEMLARAEIHPGRRGHQLLLEREALAQRMPGPQLREEMTTHLRELVGEELSDALASSPARTLIVAGARSSQLALSLPLELLFHRDDPGAIVIRRILRPSEPVEPSPAPERIVAGFALTPDQRYLPLHHEAELLAGHARVAGIALDELFVSFTGEDLLRATCGASIVHLAGHGVAGAMRCEWRDGHAAMLTSADLVETWRTSPPRLVVLGFCESSSERDELRTTQVLTRGSMALDDFASWVAATAPTPSSSMAVDLAAALPTAVIALRSSADDMQTRRFLDAFYREHLREGLSVERAYARAVADNGFHDAVGLPVPIMYVGDDRLPLATATSASRSDGPVRCLAAPQRRCLNTLYRAASPFGSAIGDSWGWRVTGEDRELRATLLSALLDGTELWRAIQGVAGPSTALGVNQVREGCVEVFSRPVVSGGMTITVVRADLDRWAHAVTLGGLCSARGDLPLADLRLVAEATCDVPAIVDAVLDGDVAAIAAHLRAVAGGEQSDGPEVTHALLELLPRAAVAPIRAWAEARWSRVAALGQVAIDLLAALAILPEDEELLQPDQPLLYALSVRTGVGVTEQTRMMAALLQAEVVSFGTGSWRSETLNMLSCDLLTARRAWSARSQPAVGALALCQIEREMRFLPSLSFLESVETSRLAALAELCLQGRHSALRSVVAELASREDGAELAATLRVRSHDIEFDRLGLEPEPTNEDPRWGAWDRLIEACRFEEAGALLDEIEAAGRATDHPLRIAADRLITRVEDADQELLLHDARALEARLAAESPAGDRSSTQMELLLIVRQAQASALRASGRQDEAAEVLLAHFAETVRAGVHVSACAYAGAHAVTTLCGLGEAERRDRSATSCWRWSRISGPRSPRCSYARQRSTCSWRRDESSTRPPPPTSWCARSVPGRRRDSTSWDSGPARARPPTSGVRAASRSSRCWRSAGVIQGCADVSRCPISLPPTGT